MSMKGLFGGTVCKTLTGITDGTGSSATTTFTFLDESDIAYIAPLTFLDADDTSYTIPATFLDADDTSYSL